MRVSKLKSDLILLALIFFGSSALAATVSISKLAAGSDNYKFSIEGPPNACADKLNVHSEIETPFDLIFQKTEQMTDLISPIKASVKDLAVDTTDDVFILEIKLNSLTQTLEFESYTGLNIQPLKRLIARKLNFLRNLSELLRSNPDEKLVVFIPLKDGRPEKESDLFDLQLLPGEADPFEGRLDHLSGPLHLRDYFEGLVENKSIVYYRAQAYVYMGKSEFTQKIKLRFQNTNTEAAADEIAMTEGCAGGYCVGDRVTKIVKYDLGNGERVQEREFTVVAIYFEGPLRGQIVIRGSGVREVLNVRLDEVNKLEL